MDKKSAQNLIKNTLENSFNKAEFFSLIRNILNDFETKIFIYRGNTIPKAFQDSIKTLERIGQYENADKKIDILIVQLKKETTLERARSKQRNFISWYLKSRGDVLKDGALVAFVTPNKEDWRFSFIKMEYRFDEKKKKIKEEWTPARRYSFLVGQHEKSHTAQSHLLPLLQSDDKNPTLEDLENAFSVEKVTKEFYEKYRDLFYHLKESLDKIIQQNKKIRKDFEKKKVHSADFSKKLLGQIVFLYFLQKKGWFGVKKGKKWGTGSKNFLRELFEKKHSDYKNFFNDILEPLFYEALRLEHRGDYYSRFNCRIPFLNGGLFDPIKAYDWVNTDIFLPNHLFSNKEKTKEGDIGNGILDIFDRYNFTVKEDEPLEKEVAIDPEMLGKVFENLLEVTDRKSKGTYYTPREIVHYMCQQSLINYLLEELKGKATKKEIETLVKHGESAIENETQTANQNKETTTYSFKISENIRKQANLIDKKLMNIRICDPAVGSGAFPVGMMNEIIKIRNTLTPFITNKDKRTSYYFKRHAIQDSLYGVDIDSGAIEISKLRLWLSLVVDEEERETIQPLPNLDYKMVCGNSLLKVEEDLFNQEHFNQLEKLKPLYFNETISSKKQKYKQQIDQLINHITNSRKIFDFEVYFSEVFHENKGFDVVIANPPYVKEYVNKSAFNGLRKSDYYQGKMDLWYLFSCKGIDILKQDSGTMAFIAQNNWVTSYGASKMRNKLIKDTQILNLIDFGDFKIFKAGIQTMVMLFQKNRDLEKYKFNYRRLSGKKLEFKDMLSLLNKEENQNVEYMNPEIERKLLINKKLTFNNLKIESILNKLIQQADFKLNNKEIAQGIVPNPDIVGSKNLKLLSKNKIKKYNIKKGDGVFVVPIHFFKKLNRHEKNYLKPLYEPMDLQRYCIASPHKKEIIYLTKLNVDNLLHIPNILAHLEKFKEIMFERRENKTNKLKHFHLHWPRDENFFNSGSKILSIRKCISPTFSYVESSAYVMMAINIIKTNRINLKYLTGILNSKLTAFWLRYQGKMQGSNYQIDKEPILSIPLLNPPEEKQKPLIKLVDKILNITKLEDYLQNPSKKKKIQEYEKQINQLVYKLYSLTPKEIKTIEGF